VQTRARGTQTDATVLAVTAANQMARSSPEILKGWLRAFRFLGHYLKLEATMEVRNRRKKHHK
jgi:hypothetical protein